MTVFATPDGRPYFAGTYFPPTSRGSMPGFAELCAWMASVYRERGGDVEAQAAELVGHMERIAARRGAETGISAATVVARGRRAGRPLRPRPGRLRRRAEVPALDRARVPARGGRCSARSPAPRGRWPRSRCAGWPTAGSATRSAAAFTATRPTTSGSSRTSRRCSTTTRCSRGSTCARRIGTPRSALARGRRADARLPGARDGAARRRLRGRPGRRLPRRRGCILRLDPGGDRRARCRPTRPARSSAASASPRTATSRAARSCTRRCRCRCSPRNSAPTRSRCCVPPPRPSTRPARAGPHPRATTS